MPTVVDSTIGGSSPDYATAALWEADTDNNLVTLDEQHNGQLQVELTITARLDFSGATTDATRYRNLTFGGTGFAYDPIDDGGSGLNTTTITNGMVRTTLEPFVRLTGIHLDLQSGATGQTLVPGNATGDTLIDGCTIRNNGTSGYCVFSSIGGITIRNTILLGGSTGGMRLDNLTAITIDNLVVYNTASGSEGIFFNADDTATTTCRNAIVMAFTFDFEFSGASSSGTYSNNISADTTAPGGDSFTNETDTSIFTAPGSDNFTLLSTGNAADNGIDLSGTFTTSFDGTARTTPWDIGAYDFVGLSPAAFLRRMEHMPAPNPLLRM